MIIEVTHEGNGVFKVWPPPSDLEARQIVERIQQDGSPGSDPDGEELEELRESLSTREAEVSDLEDKLERIRSIIDE